MTSRRGNGIASVAGLAANGGFAAASAAPDGSRQPPPAVLALHRQLADDAAAQRRATHGSEPEPLATQCGPYSWSLMSVQGVTVDEVREALDFWEDHWRRQGADDLVDEPPRTPLGLIEEVRRIRQGEAHLPPVEGPGPELGPDAARWSPDSDIDDAGTTDPAASVIDPTDPYSTDTGGEG